MSPRTLADQMAWEACEDPLLTCRRCGEIYSQMEPDYQPDRDGCPSCYEPEEDEEEATP
jgi:protein-arginine kinase activator protein McsA